MLDVLFEKCMGASIADACVALGYIELTFRSERHTLGASSHDSYLARLVRDLLKAESLLFRDEAVAGASEILCNGALHGIH